MAWTTCNKCGKTIAYLSETLPPTWCSNCRGHAVSDRERATDWAYEKAKGLLPCAPSSKSKYACEQEDHETDCPARYRSAVAAALREAVERERARTCVWEYLGEPAWENDESGTYSTACGNEYAVSIDYVVPDFCEHCGARIVVGEREGGGE